MFAEEHVELCRENFDGSNVLEICCGDGGAALSLARVFPNAAIIAVDRDSYGSSMGATIANEHLDHLHDPCGDVLHLACPDSTFDVIYGQAALHHLSNEADVILPMIERLARNFSSCDVHVFDLLAYPLKPCGRFLPDRVISALHDLDAAVMRHFPRLAPYVANFNVVFTR